jgi:membrane protein
MTLRAFFRRLWAGLVADNVDDLGAMLAFYAVLALFPMIVFVVMLTLLALPASAITQGVEMIAPAMPRSSYQLIGEQVVRMQDATTATGFLIGGAALALWGASRGVSSLMLALDRMMSLEETRGWFKRQGIAIAVTLGVALLAVGAMGLLFVGPSAGHWAADRWGLGADFDVAWTIGRWLGAAALALGVCVVIFRVLPNWRASTRDVLPGAVVAMALWLGISKVFGLYVDLAGSFDRTYGTLAGVIVFLIWLWLSAMALLVGAEVNQVLVEHKKEQLAVGRLLPLDRAQRVEEQMKLSGGDLGR